MARLTMLAFVAFLMVHAGHSLAADRTAEAEELIKRLVSPNKAPNPKGEPFVSFPDSYDDNAQKIVSQAADELLKMRFDAISVLAKHLADQRYCRSRSYSVLVDFTVGDECFRMIDKITNPEVTPDFDALPKSQFRSVKGHPMRQDVKGEWDHVGVTYLELLVHRDKAITRKSIDSWWKGFADKSLDHIHLAAVQRLIAHEEQIGFPAGADKDRYLKPYRDLESSLRTRVGAK